MELDERGWENMMYLFRLLEMAMNISVGKGVKVRSENVEFLREIRQGKYSYDQLMKQAESTFRMIKNQFESTGLPSKIDPEMVKTILLNFRK